MQIVRYFGVFTFIIFTVIWAVLVTYLKTKRNKSSSYLLFFTIFYIYFYNVLDYTLFQYQSLLLLKYFAPGLNLKGTEGSNINLLPLVSLTSQDLQTSLLNILLFLPFGFGLPFITNFRMKKTIFIGMIISISIEFLQLATGLLATTTFRITDINDVIFNTLGVTIGYIFFITFMKTLHKASHTWGIPSHPIVQHIAQRPQIKKK